MFAGYEPVHHSGSVTSGSRLIDHGFFLNLPAIPYPDWHRSVPRGRRFTTEVEIGPACLLAITVQ